MTKIMLVEDDNNLREIYEARLSAEGYEIVSAENGEAALAMAAKERPDMIISDVMMPKISGFEMLDILRNTNSLKNVKIIMLTALGQAEDSQRANQLGADRYLVKSQVTLEDIVKATHDLLDDPTKLANLPTGDVAADSAAAATSDTAATAPAEAAASTTSTVETPAAAEPVAAVTETPAEQATPAVTAPEPEPVADSAAAPVVTASDVAAATTDSVAPATDTPADPAATTVAAEPTDAPVQDAVVSSVPEPVAEPTEPAVAPEPTPAPSVISIPVSDGGDDAAAAAPDDASGATVAPISVVEPPAEAEPAPITAEPAPEPAAELPAEPSSAEAVEPEAPAAEPAAPAPDYTSPESFNNFQAAPTAPETPSPESAEAPAAEESATPAEQTSAPSVEIPTLVTSADLPPSSDVDSDPITVDGPADPVPQPEELDNFSAPVISAPDATEPAAPAAEPAAPAVQSIPITDGNEVAEAPADDSAAKDDQLREAAEDLAESASEAANTASDNADNRLKVISPLPADESKPTLHQLLAVEEAKNSAQQAAQATQQPTPNVDAYAPAANPQPAAAPPDEPDPNSISL